MISHLLVLVLIVVLFWDILNWEKDWEKVRKTHPETQHVSQDTTLYLLMAEKICTGEGKIKHPLCKPCGEKGTRTHTCQPRKKEYFIVLGKETRKVASVNPYRKHQTKIKSLAMMAFGRNEQNYLKNYRNNLNRKKKKRIKIPKDIYNPETWCSYSVYQGKEGEKKN